MAVSKSHRENGYKVMPGWRVGQAPEESTTRSGLLVPAGTKDGNDALALVDVHTGQQFWAVPSGAWRFMWPPTGTPVVAVRESQIMAEEGAPSPTSPATANTSRQTQPWVVSAA